ncbi:phosphatase PAP2 family protein [Mucilaginibacter sp.]|uniref:phosphatase PAP2 family protein n=1 Tax=Mucilaginibacter sp. TaxID=1882438 RepID=UPI002621D3EA|nr:phosphatase PAP2 family protein [Mucilaginibacter sp.]MDB4926865.1 phosphatase family protein [Mucilaginibacter sp.]
MQLDKRKKHIIQYVLGFITLGFILLTVFVCFFPLSFIDREFSAEVQEHQYPFLDTSMKAISLFGYMPYAPIMVLSTALIFLIFKYRKEALFLALTLLSGLISSVIKLLINRPRPSEPLVRIIIKTQQQSFPSGHVLFYVMFFGFLTLLMYKLKTISKYFRIPVSIISLLLIFSIPFSRIYLGAHWFTDVTAGFLLGLICLYILSFLYLKQPSS